MNAKKTSTLSYNERRILGSLTVSQKTKRELVEAIGITDSAIVKWLRNLVDKGLVYVAGTKPNHATQPSPIYAVHARHELPKADKKKAVTGRNAERHQAMCDAIAAGGPMTSEELTQWIGCKRCLIDSALTYYRKGGKCSKVFYIKSWVYVDRARVGWSAQYAVGPGVDAPKPAVDRREYMARWREKNRAKLRTENAVRRMAVNGTTCAKENPFWQLLSVAGAQDHSAKRVNRVVETA